MRDVLLPMLATRAAPFDSEEYLFEVKWDGVRALAAREGGRWRLWGRSGSDYTERYPELQVLRRLPAGTVVDGELVVLHGGRADFPALLHRHQRNPADPLGLRQRPPIHYVVFDLLFTKGQSLLREPLRQRRQRLCALLHRLDDSLLVYSDGVVGCGREFFARVVAQGHEGVMAKHLASTYRPGQRSPAWKKIKPRRMLPCVIVGYRLGRRGVHSVLVAALRDGVLRYVGQVSRGFSAATQVELMQRLAARPRLQAVVPCPTRACWVEPEVYCRIRFQEWTAHGRLRHPVFDGWLPPDLPVVAREVLTAKSSHHGSESA
jgi:bifunctional non-homologous end joining protein LigD